MKVSKLRTPRSCQIPKHARLRTHDTSENPTSHARSHFTPAGLQLFLAAGNSPVTPFPLLISILLDSSPSIRTGTPRRSGEFRYPTEFTDLARKRQIFGGIPYLNYDLHLKSIWNCFDITF